MTEKEKLVKVFDENADLYDKYRLGYPEKVVEDVIELSKIDRGDRILEIGCGTGQITIDFLKRGYDLVAIEKGESLAKIAVKNLGSYQNAQITNAAFEDWETKDKFKLVISAQAFHWIDKESGLNKISNILKASGSLGLIWNIDESGETAFYKETNKIYDEYIAGNGGRKTVAEFVNEHEDYLKTRTDFSGLVRKEYKWEKLFTKEEYLGLLRTASTHMTLPEDKRLEFFTEIASIIENHGNQVLRYFKTVLLFARKKS